MHIDQPYIVIPAKNEGGRIGGVLRHLQELDFKHIVVVNDGSTDDTEQVARSFGVTVLNHRINLGAGAATRTGMDYALSQGAEVIVTIDGDHQHLPDDIRAMVGALLEKNVDVVIGSRFFGNNGDIPLARLVYNKVGNWITFLLTGLLVNDSQSGMKAFRAEFAKNAQITRNGFEFCIEIIRHIKLQGAKWHETPISVVYTKDTMQKGQGLWTGMKMLFRLLLPRNLF